MSNSWVRVAIMRFPCVKVWRFICRFHNLSANLTFHGYLYYQQYRRISAIILGIMAITKHIGPNAVYWVVLAHVFFFVAQW